jgi:hypothetical protein
MPLRAFDKNLPRCFHSGQLQIFLGTEMRKETALAHAQHLGKRADRKTVESLNRSDIHGARQNGLAGTQSASLAARHRLFAGNASALRHGGTIAQSHHK